jgi:hypothetical protein
MEVGQMQYPRHTKPLVITILLLYHALSDSDYIIVMYGDGSVMIRNADTEVHSWTSAPTT